MKVAIVFDSLTGNTAIIAKAVRDGCKGAEVVFFGPPPPEGVEADLYFIGSWTNRGMPSGGITAFLKSLRGKRVALFGTAGMGGNRAYFSVLAERADTLLASDNTVTDTFYCCGKMPESVRERYEEMLREQPDNEMPRHMIENFDRALSHPDEADRRAAADFARKAVSSATEEKR